MNIILVHGILGFDKIGSIDYFNGIENHLKTKYTANVLIAKLNPTGSVIDRGQQLRAQILNALGKNGQQPTLDPSKPTHIIAHSMGGLDSRYILSPKNKDNIAKLITSLTTIGTPHRGSPIADLLYPFLDGTAPINVAALFKQQAKEFLHFFGIQTTGLRDLTTDVATDFDNDYIDDNNVKYFWTAGIGRTDSLFKTSKALLFTYGYMLSTGKTEDDKNNDGAVPLSSAKHGEAIGNVWFADHLDQVGHDLDHLPKGTPVQFTYLDKYDEIIKRIVS